MSDRAVYKANGLWLYNTLRYNLTAEKYPVVLRDDGICVVQVSSIAPPPGNEAHIRPLHRMGNWRVFVQILNTYDEWEFRTLRLSELPVKDEIRKVFERAFGELAQF